MAITGKNTYQDYGYTGGMQSFTAPFSGLYKFELWGAKGGNTYNGTAGGAGGYVYGHRIMTAGQTLYICVGGQGANGVSSGANVNGGYNGGGLAGGGGGGGATSLSTANTTIAGNVNACLLIAGGGGGGGGSDKTGGNGGGVSGLNGLLGSSNTNQTAPTPTTCGYCLIANPAVYFYGYVSSTVGQGISTGTTNLGASSEPGGTIHTWGNNFGSGGGGGGGRYGGSSGVQASGSGGSAYTAGLPTITFNGKSYASGYGGSNSGNGKARVTLIDISSNLYYNDTQVQKVIFNGTNVTKVVCNGTTVFG